MTQFVKTLFPIALAIMGILPFLIYGKYIDIHRRFVQLIAVALFVPAVIYCLAFGLISENAGVGLLGSMIGYVFGSTVGRDKDAA